MIGSCAHRVGKLPTAAGLSRKCCTPRLGYDDGVLLIDEHLRLDGTTVRTELGFDAGRVTVTCDDGIHGALSPAAIERVIERYGRPLDLTIAPLEEAPRLAIGGSMTLRMLRFRARVDVEARDYVVLERDGADPIAALSNGVAAALRYVCLQLAEREDK